MYTQWIFIAMSKNDITTSIFIKIVKFEVSKKKKYSV